jgi:hypothetical protein
MEEFLNLEKLVKRAWASLSATDEADRDATQCLIALEALVANGEGGFQVKDALLALQAQLHTESRHQRMMWIAKELLLRLSSGEYERLPTATDVKKKLTMGLIRRVSISDMVLAIDKELSNR